MALVRALLDGVTLIPADAKLSDDAGMLNPPEMRALDAIHLATARSLGAGLGVLLTYDQRLVAAAAWYGIPVASPS
jgi:predicted nucleic acid-binding protein